MTNCALTVLPGWVGQARAGSVNRGEVGSGEVADLALQVEAVLVPEGTEPVKVAPFMRIAPRGRNSHEGAMI